MFIEDAFGCPARWTGQFALTSEVAWGKLRGQRYREAERGQLANVTLWAASSIALNSFHVDEVEASESLCLGADIQAGLLEHLQVVI